MSRAEPKGALVAISGDPSCRHLTGQRSPSASEWVKQVQRTVARHKNRGTILAWEVMNEARPNNDPISMAWMGKAARMPKGFDPTHLVASVSEGALPGLYSFLRNQPDGLNPDLSVWALNPPEIDVVTHHAYSKYQDEGYGPPEWPVAATLAGVAAAAGGRPVLIEKCGHDTDDPTPADGPGHAATTSPTSADGP